MPVLRRLKQSGQPGLPHCEAPTKTLRTIPAAFRGFQFLPVLSQCAGRCRRCPGRGRRPISFSVGTFYPRYQLKRFVRKCLRPGLLDWERRLFSLEFIFSVAGCLCRRKSPSGSKQIYRSEPMIFTSNTSTSFALKNGNATFFLEGLVGNTICCGVGERIRPTYREVKFFWLEH